MLPMAVVELARRAAGMSTMLGMDAVQGTVSMICGAKMHQPSTIPILSKVGSTV